MLLIQEVLETVKKRNPNEPEFLQAVTEVLESIRPVIPRSILIRAVWLPASSMSKRRP